jgi:5'(3')-deoxyribonucleotidase
MNCFNCCYPFSKIFNSEDTSVYENFQGYPIFDEHYNFEIYRFCSLNCGLKHIMNSKNELVKKLKHFFDFYEVSPKEVSQALPYTRLKIFNGDLSYIEYRENFITPENFIFEDMENIQIFDYVVTDYIYNLNYPDNSFVEF